MDKQYEKYLDYTTADFALDDDFIAWVKNSNEQGKEFWDDLVATFPFLEKNIKDAWILLNSIDSSIPEIDFATKNRIWNAVISESKTGKVVLIKRNKFWMIAASVLGILMFGTYLMLNKIPSPGNDLPQAKNQPLINDIAPGGNKAILQLADGSTIILDSTHNGNIANQGQTKVIKIDGQLAYNADGSSKEILYNTISTPRGGQYQLILADGTKVWLNAASSLRFPTNFTGKERSVTLTGEGYFEVAKNANMPFKVDVAGKGEVEVLGTHFNVNAYDDEATVKTTLLEGKVLFSTVISGIKKEVKLTPGQQGQLNIKGQINLDNHPDIEQVLAWKDGIFNFSNANLQTVLRQVSRWYNVDIVYQGEVPERTFNGKMQMDLNLSQVLRLLENNNVHFRIERMNDGKEGNKLIVFK